MKNICLAPWVVCKEGVLLGLKLRAVKVSHLSLANIPQDKLDYLLKNGFLVNKEDMNDKDSEFQSLLEETNSGLTNWIWVADPELLTLAVTLRQCLSRFNSNLTWNLVADKAPILKSLKSLNSCFAQKPLILRLAHKEPINHSIFNDLYADLLAKANILWIGETIEGTHIGPLFRSIEESKHYFMATKVWYFSNTLLKAGFTDYWPTSIYLNLVNHLENTASAIQQVIESGPGICCLLPENKLVSLWTNLLHHPVMEQDFFKKQFWSKGLIRNYKMAELEFIPGTYISSCRTPCHGIDYLEGNSGKGVNVEMATYSLVGEAIERFSAWQSNRQSEHTEIFSQPNSGIIYNIQEFHPFGPKWESYLHTPTALPLCQVKDAINPKINCFVPECLLPFPYQATRKEHDATTSGTSGLATHSNYNMALIKGSLELFERHNFYPSFIKQLPGFILDFSNTHPSLLKHCTELPIFLECLKKNSLDFWFLIYHPTSIPIIHCFLRDQKAQLLSRGSGSGLSFKEAILGALLEALQIREQLLKTIKSNPNRPEDSWTHPKVIEDVLHYLNQCHPLPLKDYPALCTQYTPPLLLEEIKKRLASMQKPLLIAELPCPIQKWISLRVLIPGFTIHQYPSQSAGGMCLLNPTFKHTIPT